MNTGLFGVKLLEADRTISTPFAFPPDPVSSGHTTQESNRQARIIDRHDQ